jgi:hypothetical protein
MSKPKEEPDIGFQEALRRIAKTPKGVVVNKKTPAKKSLVYKDLKSYNKMEADESPPPVKPK